MRLGTAYEAQVQRREVRAAVDVKRPARQGSGCPAVYFRRPHAAVQASEFRVDPLKAALDPGYALVAALLLQRCQQWPAMWQEDVQAGFRHWPGRGPDGLERRFHLVILFLRDRVELVIVTACAIHCEAQEGLGDRAQHVLEQVLSDQGSLVPKGRRQAHGIDRAQGEHRGRHDRVVADRFGHVARQLLDRELAVGLVVVETADQVVSIRPGVLAREVPLESLALGEPDQVQPVPRPALAVVRRRQQAIHELLVSVG